MPVSVYDEEYKPGVPLNLAIAALARSSKVKTMPWSVSRWNASREEVLAHEKEMQEKAVKEKEKQMEEMKERVRNATMNAKNNLVIDSEILNSERVGSEGSNSSSWFVVPFSNVDDADNQSNFVSLLL